MVAISISQSRALMVILRNEVIGSPVCTIVNLSVAARLPQLFYGHVSSVSVHRAVLANDFSVASRSEIAA